MLLSNNRIRTASMIFFICVVLALAILPTCRDKQVNEKADGTESLYENVHAGQTLVLSKILKESSGDVNVAKEEIVGEVILNRTEVPKVKSESVKLASNGNPYVYYEVYDFFYGSDDYHSLDYDLQEYTYDLCIEYGIEEYYTLILCQLYYESKYDATAVSPSNDYGIAQINICNHNWLSNKLGITDFLDARQSITCNIYMMSSYLKKYDVESSLFCYNTGKANGSNTYSDNIIYMWDNGVREISER